MFFKLNIYIYLLHLLPEVTSLNIAVCRYLNKHFVYVNCLIQVECFAGNSVKGNVKYEVLKLENQSKIE